MKVLSYNVRGVGGFEKRAEVRRFTQEKHPFVVCLQESKLGVIDDLTIKSIWGECSLWVFLSSFSGGIWRVSNYLGHSGGGGLV